MAGGTLNINAGGLVSVGFELNLGNRGTVHLNGGTLSVGGVIFESTPHMNFNAGTLRFTDDVTLTDPMLDVIFGQSHTIAPLRHLMIDGTPTLQSSLILDGGILTVPTLAVGSPLQFDSGTLNLTGANLTVGNGGLFGNTVTLDDRNINVTNSTTIQPGGRLLMQGGSFFSGAGINNQGEIALSNPITQIDGGLITNTGVIRGTGLIKNPVQNSATGLLEVNPADRLDFDGTVTNVGNIIARDAELRFDGGLNNGGLFQFSQGTTQVFGNIAHSGEIRVSTGTTAVFFGNITGAGSFSGGGTKFFEGGSSAAVAAIDTAGHTVVESGATLSATRIREQSLTINGSVNIVPAGTDASSSRLSSLAIGQGGRMDLANNDLIVDYTGPSPSSAVSQLLIRGRSGGSWTGDGLTSSIAAAHPSHATTLGAMEASDFTAATGANTFSGQTIDNSAILVKYTWYGDTDFNGVVNFDDYARIDTGFNLGRSGWVNGDFDFNNIVNFDDYSLIDNAFNAAKRYAPAGDFVSGWQRPQRKRNGWLGTAIRRRALRHVRTTICRRVPRCSAGASEHIHDRRYRVRRSPGSPPTRGEYAGHASGVNANRACPCRGC